MPRSVGGTSHPSSISDAGLEGVGEPNAIDPNVATSAKLSDEDGSGALLRGRLIDKMQELEKTMLEQHRLIEELQSTQSKVPEATTN